MSQASHAKIVQRARAKIKLLRGAVRRLSVINDDPEFSQKTARGMHLRAGEMYALVLDSGFDPPVRSRLCGELTDAMRDLREFL